jgi:enoyl-CoA hydratase
VAIHYDKSYHVVTITIDRYETRNAIDIEHAEALVSSWLRFRDDDDAWVAIITGVGDAFCSGGDLRTMAQAAREAAATGSSPTRDRMLNHGRGSFTLKGLDIFKPVIAAVNGKCVGGGMELLGGTDIRIASSEAVFAIIEPRRGLMAGGGTTSRLPRQLSWPAAMELLLTARTTSAERALALGLVNEVVAPSAVMDTARQWASEIARCAPLAVQGTKKSALLGFRAGTLDDAYRIEEECSRGVIATEDAREGPAAFLEKRAPRWTAR